jgi:hypothetical protein
MDEAAHVGALGVLRQADRQGDGGDGALGLRRAVEHGDRVAQIADADLLNRHLAMIGVVFDIL